MSTTTDTTEGKNAGIAENRIGSQVVLARPLDDVVDEIVEFIHANVQLHDLFGEPANRAVLDEMRPWITEALVVCQKPVQSKSSGNSGSMGMSDG